MAIFKRLMMGVTLSFRFLRLYANIKRYIDEFITHKYLYINEENLTITLFSIVFLTTVMDTKSNQSLKKKKLLCLI